MGALAVDHARKLVGDRGIAGTLESVHFLKESFDVIVFSHSLEHIF